LAERQAVKEARDGDAPADAAPGVHAVHDELELGGVDAEADPADLAADLARVAVREAAHGGGGLAPVEHGKGDFTIGGVEVGGCGPDFRREVGWCAPSQVAEELVDGDACVGGGDHGILPFCCLWTARKCTAKVVHRLENDWDMFYDDHGNCKVSVR
jgi:hypothetical protein